MATLFACPSVPYHTTVISVTVNVRQEYDARNVFVFITFVQIVAGARGVDFEAVIEMVKPLAADRLLRPAGQCRISGRSPRCRGGSENENETGHGRNVARNNRWLPGCRSTQ